MGVVSVYSYIFTKTKKEQKLQNIKYAIYKKKKGEMFEMFRNFPNVSNISNAFWHFGSICLDMRSQIGFIEVILGWSSGELGVCAGMLAVRRGSLS